MIEQNKRYLLKHANDEENELLDCLENEGEASQLSQAAQTYYCEARSEWVDKMMRIKPGDPLEYTRAYGGYKLERHIVRELWKKNEVASPRYQDSGIGDLQAFQPSRRTESRPIPIQGTSTYATTRSSFAPSRLTSPYYSHQPTTVKQEPTDAISGSYGTGTGSPYSESAWNRHDSQSSYATTSQSSIYTPYGSEMVTVKEEEEESDMSMTDATPTITCTHPTVRRFPEFIHNPPTSACTPTTVRRFPEFIHVTPTTTGTTPTVYRFPDLRQSASSSVSSSSIGRFDHGW